MKKLTTILSVALLSISVLGQVPQSFNYQAIFQDAALGIYKKSSVAVIIQIIQGSPSGAEVYTEIHSTTTNEKGLFTIQIGSVNPDDFILINWAEGPFYLGVNVNGTDFGTSQILSIPFALYSEKTGPHIHSEAEIQDLHHYSDMNIGGDEVAFRNWDKDNSDDFDGKYSSLENAPVNLSDLNNDLGFLVSENDGSPENELQDLIIVNDSLSIENGSGGVDLTKYIDDDDSDPQNEIQALSIKDDTLRLSDGGFVRLPGFSPPQFIPKVEYGVTTSLREIDISEDIGTNISALICVVVFRTQWHIDFWGNCYFHAYYGSRSGNEVIRLEVPYEDAKSTSGYTQSGLTRMSVMVPVSNGNKIYIDGQGVLSLEVLGYY